MHGPCEQEEKRVDVTFQTAESRGRMPSRIKATLRTKWQPKESQFHNLFNKYLLVYFFVLVTTGNVNNTKSDAK